METEKEIIRDIYHYLRDHNDPPPAGTKGCVAFWADAANGICVLVNDKWRDHPLAVAMCTAVYSYLEHKCTSNRKEVPT